MAARVINDTVVGFYEQISLVGFKTVLEDRRSGLVEAGYVVLKGAAEPDLEQLKVELEKMYNELGYNVKEAIYDEHREAELDGLLMFDSLGDKKAVKEEKREE